MNATFVQKNKNILARHEKVATQRVTENIIHKVACRIYKIACRIYKIACRFYKIACRIYIFSLLHKRCKVAKELHRENQA